MCEQMQNTASRCSGCIGWANDGQIEICPPLTIIAFELCQGKPVHIAEEKVREIRRPLQFVWLDKTLLNQLILLFSRSPSLLWV